MAAQDIAAGTGRDLPQEQGSGGAQDAPARKINDLSIQIATVNGSGSQSANAVLLRSIFRMGIPVSGKNLFPSNIAGLPTWYTIRASKDGYVARKKEIDVVIAMNAETAQEDVKSLRPGSVAIYEESYKLNELRGDVAFYPVPFDKLIAGVCPEAKLRKLVKNMIYVGVAAWLLDLSMEAVESALRQQFAKKVKAADLNWGAVQAGVEFAKANFTKQDPFALEPMDATGGKIIIDGNAAAALGCVFAGCTVVMWYPITPSTSLVEAFIDYAKKYRVEADGKATFAIVQAEDELAAIGGVLGAGWRSSRGWAITRSCRA
jgi:2-oxoglutarate ferredoxin oxidoreductase subunit alpha